MRISQQERIEYQSAVLNNESKYNRDSTLYLGMILGTNFQRQTFMIVQTPEGARRIRGVIWALTDKQVLLQDHRRIPLSAVSAATLA